MVTKETLNTIKEMIKQNHSELKEIIDENLVLQEYFAFLLEQWLDKTGYLGTLAILNASMKQLLIMASIKASSQQLPKEGSNT